MLDLKRLNIFRAVARHGSFSRAAAELSYTQPAISHHIAALEREVGARLLDRRPHGLRLTRAGEVLERHAEILLERASDAEAELERVTGMRAPTVRLGAFGTACASFVPGAIADYRAAHPDAELTLAEADPDDALARVRSQAIDLGVVFDTESHPLIVSARIRLEPLCEDPMVLVVPTTHAVADLARIDLRALAHERWIEGAGDDTPWSTVLLDLCEAHGFRPRVAFGSGNHQVVQRLVAAGMGVALVPRLALERPEPGTRSIPIDGGEPHRRVWLADRASTVRRPAVEAMRKALRVAVAREQSAPR